MKSFFLILAVFLSGFFCDGNTRCEDSRCGYDGTVVESKGQDRNDNNPDYKSLGLLPSRTAGYSGENDSVTSSVRSTNSGRRVQPSGKAPFRIIKDGKVIDRHNFHSSPEYCLLFSFHHHWGLEYASY